MRKGIWIMVSCLMVLSLALAACAPVATQTTSTTQTTGTTPTSTTLTTTTAPTTPTTTGPTVETPKYGGVLNFALSADVLGFDEGLGVQHYSNYAGHLTNEELLTGDWAKGRAGTGEITWTGVGAMILKYETGALAESWEIPQAGHMIFHIRHGIHYALNPKSEASRLVNGRELNANDVVFSLQRYCTLPTAYIRTGSASMATTTNITAPDQWTVDIKCPPDQFLLAAWNLPDFAEIEPPEVIQKYGDMHDWKVSSGTGPFMLIDYIPGSQLVFVKNTNYWAKDPVGPGKGNQLPYLDGVKYLVLPDKSTQLAAFRTGKVDVLSALLWDDAKEFLQNPKMKYDNYVASASRGIYMRTDKPDLPFKDKRVRQALMMATDFEGINTLLFAGKANINSFPITPVGGYEKAYLPLEEATEEGRQLYVYNPDKAKQLLKDAGYPNGFKTKVYSANTQIYSDYLAVVNSMWAKVGVNLEISLMEPNVFNSFWANKSHDQMIYSTIPGIVGAMKSINFAGTNYHNASFINDSYVNSMIAKQYDAFNKGDEDQFLLTFKEMSKYVIEQAWCIPTPAAYPYTVWWPWLQNYHGEWAVGYNTMYNFCQWVWVDTDLKKSMGH